MHFVVLGYDGTDPEALNRRLAVRDQHIKLGEELKANGKALYGVAMLNEQQEMIGSVYVVNFNDRSELDQWLKIEPYVTGNVWQKIEVNPCKIGPSFFKD